MKSCYNIDKHYLYYDTYHYKTQQTDVVQQLNNILTNVLNIDGLSRQAQE